MAGPFFDMHCHLDFAPNAQDAAARLDTLGAGAFAVGVMPARVPRTLAGSSVRWGVGLHPWWVADGRVGAADVEAAVALVEQTIYIGEVGLDYGRTHGQRTDAQRQAFAAIAAACAEAGGRVLSLHAVRSATDVLDILKDTGALKSCTCILHWFSGTSDELSRAVRSGCHFSVGLPMLASRRGREYARQIPAGRLLLETDEPPAGQDYDVDAIQERLAQTCTEIARLRGGDPDALAEAIAATSRDLLGR